MSTPNDNHLEVLLTAYADGSLHEDGCAFIERQLEEHPELRDRLGEIRALQHLLRSSLPTGPHRLDEKHRDAVMAAARRPQRSRRWIVYLAAACLALVVSGMTLAVTRLHSPSRGEYLNGGDSLSAYAVEPPVRTMAIKPPIEDHDNFDSFPGPSLDIPGQVSRPGEITLGVGRETTISGFTANDGILLLPGARTGMNSSNFQADGSRLDTPTETAAPSPIGGVWADAGKTQTPPTRQSAIAMGEGKGYLGANGDGKDQGGRKEIEALKPAAPPPAAAPAAAMPAKPRLELAAAAQKGKSHQGPKETRSGRDKALTSPLPNGERAWTLKQGQAKNQSNPPASPLLDETSRKDQTRRIEELGYLAMDGRLPEFTPRIKVTEVEDDLDSTREGGVINGLPVPTTSQIRDLNSPRERGVIAGTWAPLNQRDLIAALTNRGLAERSAGRLDVVLQQQWNAPIQTQAAPIRLSANAEKQAAATGSTNNSVGQNLLLTANRNHLQLVPVPGGIEVQAAQRPLDPTAFYGLNRDEFRAAFGSTPMQAITDDPQQTFAIDASTSSFAAARAALDAGRLPDAGAMEPQHVYNAVPTDYPQPSGDEAFQLYAEAGPSPFANGPAAGRTALVALGVVSRHADAAERMPLDLVIALDVSGSMGRPGGLDRASAGLQALLPQLDARDRVAVVAFGDVARIVLPAVAGDQRQRISSALAGLRPEGATNAADGLALAYQVAGEIVAPGRSCRVLLATDGAALAGEAATTAEAAVERWRGRGVSLLIVGCAGESYDSAALERLARHGDGEHLVAACDAAARELFTTRLMPARLAVLARDAKIQMTWNPARVSHARLIGFESRRLAHEQFRDNSVDAGELTQDAQATALFEVILSEHGSGPLGTAGVRYQDTRLNRVVELARPLPGGLVAAVDSQRLRLLACAAELGELMQAGWWRNVRCSAGSDAHNRLLGELAGLEHPFARVLERLTRTHQNLERQDATP